MRGTDPIRIRPRPHLVVAGPHAGARVVPIPDPLAGLRFAIPAAPRPLYREIDGPHAGRVLATDARHVREIAGQGKEPAHAPD